MLALLLTKVGAKWTRDDHQTKTDEPRSAFIVYTEHRRDVFLPCPVYTVWDFDKDENVLSIQVNH
jgi:hypothetical protein